MTINVKKYVQVTSVIVFDKPKKINESINFKLTLNISSNKKIIIFSGRLTIENIVLPNAEIIIFLNDEQGEVMALTTVTNEVGEFISTAETLEVGSYRAIATSIVDGREVLSPEITFDILAVPELELTLSVDVEENEATFSGLLTKDDVGVIGEDIIITIEKIE